MASASCRFSDCSGTPIGFLNSASSCRGLIGTGADLGVAGEERVEGLALRPRVLGERLVCGEEDIEEVWKKGEKLLNHGQSFLVHQEQSSDPWVIILSRNGDANMTFNTTIVRKVGNDCDFVWCR